MKPTFFPNSAAFRRWLEKNHRHATELWVGFYKKGAAKTGITYTEAVEEALCFGWIDGIVKRIDADSYTHRFTPRKPQSIWSNRNVSHVARLTAAGHMHASGLAAFAARQTARTGIYAFEAKTPPTLPAAYQKAFRAVPSAWDFFSAQPPGYRRLALWRVISAKLETTRLRRLERLIAASAAGKRLE